MKTISSGLAAAVVHQSDLSGFVRYIFSAGHRKRVYSRTRVEGVRAEEKKRQVVRTEHRLAEEKQASDENMRIVTQQESL